MRLGSPEHLRSAVDRLDGALASALPAAKTAPRERLPEPRGQHLSLAVAEIHARAKKSRSWLRSFASAQSAFAYGAAARRGFTG